MYDPLLLTLLAETRTLIEEVGGTDWPAVWTGFAATLIGAGVGAVGGAFAAIGAAKKTRRQEKLEELAATLDAIESVHMTYLSEVVEALSKGGFDSARHMVCDRLGQENAVKSLGIELLFAIHLPRRRAEAKDFVEELSQMLSEVTTILYNRSDLELDRFACDFGASFDEITKKLDGLKQGLLKEL